MWPILISLVIGVSVVFERFWMLMRSKSAPDSLLDGILTALDRDDLAGAIALCSNTPGSLANILHAGLLRTRMGIRQVEQAIERAGAIEMGFLEKNLVWLASVVSIAPMLGFLGTALGAVNALDFVARTNQVLPGHIAEGIADSLFPMMFGLTVAIPIEAAHKFIVLRIDKLVIEMEETTQKFVDALVERERTDTD